MVDTRGELSNHQVSQLIDVIQDWARIIKAPPALNTKSFNWQPLARAA